MALFLTLALATAGRADDTLETEEQLDIARAKLGGGVAVTLVGAVLGATGAGLLASDPPGPSGQDQAKQGALGLGISAFVLAAVGIPLAVVGARDLRALKKQKLVVAPSSVQISF